MSKSRTSLLNTVFRDLLLPGIIAAVLGVLIVYNLVKEEYDELQDVALMSKAQLILQVIEAHASAPDLPASVNLADMLAFEQVIITDDDERSIFWLLDAEAQVIAQSANADPALLPAQIDGLMTAQAHRIASATATGPEPLTVVVATPMSERNEAIRDVLLGVILGFGLLGMLGAIAAYRAIRRSAAVIADLSVEIATKDVHDLSPINRGNAFAEIEPAIDTVDTLMARLDAALTAERAFATNAAHELRTPVAICLAHVQRLKAKLADPATLGSAAEIEQGLKRLTRLIERLLQLSRVQSGLGSGATVTDIVPVIRLLLRELRDRVATPEMLEVAEPQSSWFSPVDPDAVGIILNNLFDNALKHASGTVPMVVDASQTGRIVISNDCAPLASADLRKISQRFVRNAPLSDGFGLGLSIVQELCVQSGTEFEITSPTPGQTSGFTAVLIFPLGENPAQSVTE
ncbi:two-component system, OmpR family, sensor kinase [Sulfitobacter brevis]|uniref:histidine kinase n=1 Tax=Sulfitobacter brevis TaxID=74348 RepID=A0A1I1WTT4_9RHOB|nr:HAMP domain-containing sensor histidine kinase [Sulfitobacter brevis]SFD98615.1 two-component system, OmpR family, sensor kinase [Sulfitobacter brevis]